MTQEKVTYGSSRHLGAGRGEARAKPRGVRHFTTKFEDLYILAKSVVAATGKWSYRYYGFFFAGNFVLEF